LIISLAGLLRAAFAEWSQAFSAAAVWRIIVAEIIIVPVPWPRLVKRAATVSRCIFIKAGFGVTVVSVRTAAWIPQRVARIIISAAIAAAIVASAVLGVTPGAVKIATFAKAAAAVAGSILVRICAPAMTTLAIAAPAVVITRAAEISSQLNARRCALAGVGIAQDSRLQRRCAVKRARPAGSKKAGEDEFGKHLCGLSRLVPLPSLARKRRF